MCFQKKLKWDSQKVDKEKLFSFSLLRAEEDFYMKDQNIYTVSEISMLLRGMISLSQLDRGRDIRKKVFRDLKSQLLLL